MNTDEWITINDVHTFRKSSIEGFSSDFNQSEMYLYVIVSGTKYLVDVEEFNHSIRPKDRESAVKQYHKRRITELTPSLENKKETI